MLLAPRPKIPTLCSKTVSLQSGDVSSPISSPSLAFLSFWLQGALCLCVFVYLCVFPCVCLCVPRKGQSANNEQKFKITSEAAKNEAAVTTMDGARHSMLFLPWF